MLLNRKNKRGGFTLVEMIVALAIAAVCISLGGGVLISGTNFLGAAGSAADEKRVAESTADYIKKELLYAGAIEVVQAGAPPAAADIPENSRLIFIGNSAGTKTEKQGYLFVQKAGESPVDPYGSEYYKTNSLALDYNATIDENGEKAFSITVYTYNREGKRRYVISKTFRLVNAGADAAPTAAQAISSLDHTYYLLLTDQALPAPDEPGESGGQNPALPPGPESFYRDGAKADQREMTWVVPKTQTYKITMWGANGGAAAGVECRGGYSCGLIDLKAGTVLYIKVGSVGEANTDTNAVNKGGFNGGGDAKNSGVNLRTAGGGATDIRALEDDLCHRIMVAGGGGGNAANIAGAIAGYGGGTSGGSSYYTSSSTGKTVAATGGTQTAPGANKQTASTAGVPAGFGFGGSAPSLNLAGGGGGWFGGGAGSGGAGGSGYILYSKESTGTQYASAIIDGYFPEYKDFFFHGDGYNSIGIGGLLCTATSSSTDPITGSPAKNNGNGYITVAPGTKLWS